MEVKLEQLIDKIKQEGVEEAKKQAENILAETEKEVKRIIDDAHAQAKKIKEEAQTQSEQLKQNTEEALKQSARDVTLMVREKLSAIMDSILKRNIDQGLSVEFLKDLIANVIDKWSQDRSVNLDVLVNQEDKQRLEEMLFAQIGHELRSNVEIKINNSIDKGFRIGTHDGNVYYDLSDESIIEALKVFLNPALARVLET